MKNIYALLIISFIFTISCNQDFGRKKIVYYNSFPKSVFLKTEKVYRIQDEIYPMLMGVKDSILVLCDINSDIHFYTYTVPNIKYRGSFGKQGKGPNDLLDPVFWGEFENDKNNNKIWVYQTNRMLFTLVNVINSVKSKNASIERNIVMPPEIGAAVNIIALKNNMFIGGGRVEQGEFFVYNNATQKIHWKPIISDNKNYIEKVKSANLLSSYKQGIIKIKPDKSKFVKVFSYMPIIDVYDENAELSFSIIAENCKFPKIGNKQFDKEAKVFYTNVFLTDKYIYALRQNCTLIQLSQNLCPQVEINVFDWKGKAICKYIIKESLGSLAPFAIDEKNNKIYTIGIQETGNFIKVYNLIHLNK